MSLCTIRRIRCRPDPHDAAWVGANETSRVMKDLTDLCAMTRHELSERTAIPDAYCWPLWAALSTIPKGNFLAAKAGPVNKKPEDGLFVSPSGKPDRYEQADTLRNVRPVQDDMLTDTPCANTLRGRDD